MAVTKYAHELDTAPSGYNRAKVEFDLSQVVYVMHS
jgi:hypothetical protein